MKGKDLYPGLTKEKLLKELDELISDNLRKELKKFNEEIFEMMMNGSGTLAHPPVHEKILEVIKVKEDELKKKNYTTWFDPGIQNNETFEKK